MPTSSSKMERSTPSDEVEVEVEAAATTFHGFPKIAAELRLMIWKYAAIQSERAIIKLKAYNHAKKGKKRVRFSSENVLHIVLSACKDSRSAILKILTTYIQPPGMERKIRHHPEDWILIYHEEDEDNFKCPKVPIIASKSKGCRKGLQKAFKDVKHLAVLTGFHDFEPSSRGSLICFPSLETIIQIRESTKFEVTGKFEVTRDNKQIVMAGHDSLYVSTISTMETLFFELRVNLWCLLNAKGRKIPVFKTVAPYPKSS